MDSEILSKSYVPQQVESRWYSYWEKEGLFSAEEVSDKKPFSIVIPPPNVTGALHMGHAYNNTLQDILCRYRRMQGYNVLWMPGTDHAGIATQNVVEKELAKEGLTRHAIGRKKFIERVWQWREEYGHRIVQQLKRIGASCDWDRERFTLDEGLSRAVRTVFVKLYEEGLIYRGNYITNWCPRCQTALSDLEVEHEDHNGHLYYIKYPLEDMEGEVIVATTRPETMFGDTAVAFNPNDDRYRSLKGKRAILPLMNRPIPIIFDEYVDIGFGTGALKITPAHDPHDFEIGLRHNLEAIQVIGKDGRMSEQAGPFQGQDRFDCRENVIRALKTQGLLEKIEPYQYSVGHCQRCRTTVEPNLSRQWFVKVKPLAKEATAAVRTGAIRMIPDTWTNTFFDWMNNIRDWCISRQIWWGHRIPAWTCDTCGKLIVSIEAPSACPACNGTSLTQETDVLDTWFSSALWPFSTMGWPDETPLLKTFYPTSVLITGFDILFFWVARMMMMGLHFMKDVPFREVYIHALVRDAEGKKMSKSKGNVIDPLQVMERFGTDAFRFTLTAFAAQGRDIKLSEERIEGYRHFINKIWNAFRFSLQHLKGFDPDYSLKDVRHLSLVNRWILSRLNSVVGTLIRALDEYKFNEAASALYQFVWHEFCDWYLVIIKPILYRTSASGADRKLEEPKKSEDYEATLFILYFVLDKTLRLLHPFIPFVTEELWHKLPGTSGSIMRAQFPASNPQHHDTEAEAAMNLVMGITSGIRNIRGEMNLPPSLVVDATVQCPDSRVRQQIEDHREIINNMARLQTLNVMPPGDPPPSSATTVYDNLAIFVSLKGIIDFKAEQARLSKEIAKTTKELERLSKKLSNQDFLHKAPADVVEGVHEKRERLAEKKRKLQQHLDVISASDQ